MATEKDKPVSARDLPPEFNAAVKRVLGYRPATSEDKKRSRQERRTRIKDAPTTPATTCLVVTAGETAPPDESGVLHFRHLMLYGDTLSP